MEKLFYASLIIYAVMTFVTIVLYRNDKQKAIKGKYRTKEKTLLLSSFLFGSLGGLISLYYLRHKNKHFWFIVVNWVSLILHIAIIIFLYTQAF